jgi:phenylacetate-CoA ligase
MTLKVECSSRDNGLSAAIADSLRSVTKLGGVVELVSPGALPNDGKVIEDTRNAQA